MAKVSADRRDEYFRERREALLDAALKVLSRDGFERATMSEIAREASVAKGTIYNYFSSKGEVLACVLQERTRLLERILEDVEVTPTEALTAIAQVFLDETIDRQPELARLVLLESPRFPELAREMLGRLLAAGNRTVAHYLERQAELGRLDPRPDWETTSLGFFGMLVAYLLGHEILAGSEMLPAKRTAFVRDAVDVFLYGVSSRRPDQQTDGTGRCPLSITTTG